MLNWVRRLLINRRRAIFRYWDGARLRGIDPMVAYRALKSHPTFDDAVHLKAADTGDLEALAIVLQATRDVFGVRPWSEDFSGLTENETIGLLNDFEAYLEALKKNGSPPPTSPESTAPPFSGETSSSMNAGSACGSTVPAASDAGPSQ